ncbi:Der1-like family [Achlya hypogyna]|uniref:Derlin n=1 Tax=Achlya hypogyna TaxID=1202772 RepID=A0A1V9ZV38_ACHHY|nr:Der1-like family [Achlya hypogyna]
MSSPEAWYNGLPRITRAYLTTCFAATCLSQFGMLNPRSIYLDLELVFYKFHFWRLITCFCYVGKFSFHFLVCLLLLGQYGSRLEADPFVAGGGPTADFAFMMLCGASVLWIVGGFMGYFFLGEPMIFMILYMWSRKNPTQIVSFWGFKFEALYFPWAMIAFTLLTGNDPLPQLAGLFAGHVYYFLLEILPNTKGITLLQTPQVLINCFPSEARPVYGAAPAGQRAGAEATGPSRYNWGSGRTLGTQ